MLNWFAKKKANFLTTDVHSHLLPALDDGVKSLQESLTIIRQMNDLGFKKLITTPHVISDHYPNTSETILKVSNQLQEAVHQEGIDVVINAAAEYFVDEHFQKFIRSGEQILTFGNRYVLIETGFMSKPLILTDVVFELHSMGYQPVLAHPERYAYIQQDTEEAFRLKDAGLLFQLNVMSFTGHYAESALECAKFLVQKELVDLLGSDVHRIKHVELYKKAIQSKIFQSCGQLPLLNGAL